MTEIHDDLIAVLDAVHVETPSRYSVLGEVREHGPSEGATPVEPSRLVSALTLDLYERLYLRPSSPQSVGADELARRDLLSALSAANTGRGTWESGWTVRRVEPDGQLSVTKADIAFWVSASSVRIANARPEVGLSCRVWIPKEMRELVPGFYCAAR